MPAPQNATAPAPLHLGACKKEAVWQQCLVCMLPHLVGPARDTVSALLWTWAEADKLCTMYSFISASLIAQLAKNLPAMQKTLVRFLGQEDPLEKGKAIHPSILAWRIPWTVCMAHGVTKSQTQLSSFHFHFLSREYSGLPQI